MQRQVKLLAGLLQVAGLLEVLGAGQMHAQDIAGQAAYFCRQVPYVRIALALIGESIDRAFGRGILLLFHQQVGFGKGQREVVRITLLQPTVALQCLRQSARIGVDLDLGEVDRQVIRCRFEQRGEGACGFAVLAAAAECQRQAIARRCMLAAVIVQQGAEALGREPRALLVLQLNPGTHHLEVE